MPNSMEALTEWHDLRDRITKIERDVSEFRSDHERDISDLRVTHERFTKDIRDQQDERYADQRKDHERITKLELQIAHSLAYLQSGMEQLLKANEEQLKHRADTDARLSKVENWQSNMSGRLAVLVLIGLALAGIVGGLVQKYYIEPRLEVKLTQAINVDENNAYKLPTSR